MELIGGLYKRCDQEGKIGKARWGPDQFGQTERAAGSLKGRVTTYTGVREASRNEVRVEIFWHDGGGIGWWDLDKRIRQQRGYVELSNQDLVRRR